MSNGYDALDNTIDKLRKRIRELEAEVDRLKAELDKARYALEHRGDWSAPYIDRLRAALRRLEWVKNLGFCLLRDGRVKTDVMGCFVCDTPENPAGIHKPRCWLAKLLDGKDETAS